MVIYKNVFYWTF